MSNEDVNAPVADTDKLRVTAEMSRDDAECRPLPLRIATEPIYCHPRIEPVVPYQGEPGLEATGHELTEGNQ